MSEGSNGHSHGTAGAEDRSSPRPIPDDPDAAMHELRRLLLSPEHAELEALRHLVRELQARHPERVAKVLPEAIARRATDDDQLAEALRPTIEDTLHRSVRRDPQTLADALFPVIGPAIRKSIRETLSSMLQTINQTLEHSLSPRSLRWRLEAWRTSQSFAQIVLRHTLQYRVEHLFLIDRETGLPLAHVIDDEVAASEADELQDGALLTSMLTAIQDFAEDSFATAETETLETLQVGDLSVWIEPGPRALLAAVIRGIPPADLRETLRDLNETIHLRFHDALTTYDGDPTPFDATEPLLRTGLREQFRKPDRTLSPALGVLLAVVAVLIAVWVVREVQERQRWHAFLELLEHEPGLVVVDTDRSWSTQSLRGLRDPLATDPDALRRQSGLRAEDVTARWIPYLALDSAIILQRAEHRLAPPSSVTLSLRGDTLVATGTASPAWSDAARTGVRYLPGLTAFHHADPVAQRLDAARSALEERSIRFVPGTAQLRPGQEAALQALDRAARSLLETARSTEAAVQLQILGHASAEGSAAFNERLSQARADSIRQRFLGLGWPADRVTTLGTGTPRFPRADASPEERAANRSVSFRVVRDTTDS